MLKSYKILALLLTYPNEEIYNFLPEVEDQLVEEQLFDDEIIDGVGKFTEFFGSQPLMRWQEHYVQLFDYSRTASLYLFEHLHGDSKDRGQAMVDLVDLYAEGGLNIESKELPDYLPVFLEYLSLQSPEKAAAYLAEVVDIVGFIHEKLAKKDNPFQYLLAAVVSLSARMPNKAKITKMGTMMPEISLDEAYEEKPVTFGCDNSTNI